MHTSGEFRRYADEQESENRLAQRKVQNALRDAAAHIDRLEKRLLEVDAVCCDYEQQRDNALREVKQLRERVEVAERVNDADELERRHAVAALGEDADKFRSERDEARRRICEDESYNYKRGVTPRDIAKDRGWDCFKENTDGT